MSQTHAAADDSLSAERHFRDLAEFLPHMVWTCSADGLCDYLSPQWLSYTGVPLAGQLGSAWLCQLHPDDIEPTKARWSVATANATPFDTEFRIRRFDGVYRWFKARAVPSLDSSGRALKWFGSNTDIQDLRDAQEATARLNQELEARVLTRTEELRAANANLEAVALQLQAAQRITHVGSWQLDVASGDVTWSDELFCILGLDPRQGAPNYRDQATLFTPESWERLKPAIADAVATGTGYELTLTVRRPDGELRTAVARAEALRNESGLVARLVGTLQDTTERERVDARLRQLSERLQLAASAAKIGVWDWDMTKDELVWDETMHHLYEMPRDRFLGTADTWRAAIHPDDLAEAEAALARAIQGPDDFSTTFRIVCGGGVIKHLRAAAAVHRDAQGRAQRMVGVNWDVTEKNKAELALRKSEALQRAILAHAGPAIIATNRKGFITLFNRGAEELFGYAASEVIGRATPMRIHDADEVEARRLALERELGRSVSTPMEVFTIKTRDGGADANEWTCVRKDGSRVPVLLTVTALRDDTRAISGYLGVSINLTQRKQQERELIALNCLLAERTAQAESANDAKSMFVANVSHEIRTPLGAIMGVAYLLSKTALDDEQRGLLLTIERSAKTLLGMINDVLDLSKIEAQQLSLDVAPFRLTQVVDELGGLMSGFALGKPLDLAIDVDPNVPDYLTGDRVRLMQILTNLAGNAIKFTAAGEVRVRITCIRQQADEIWLKAEVQDSGPGIDDALLPKLFTRFTQAEEASARRAGGTGLGLAIVKQLANLMGGRVGVTSRRGTGSTFWCELPFGKIISLRPKPHSSELLVVRAVSLGAEDPHHNVDASAPPTALRRLPGVRALVVDDSDINRDIASRILALEGADIETASNGREAVERVRREPRRYDLVLMDVQMPEIDGIEAVRQIREFASPADLPIVALTAGALASERQRALATGMNDFIAKPFEPEKLITNVRRHVERVRGRALGVSSFPTPVKHGAWPIIAGIHTDDVYTRLSGDTPLFRALLSRLLAELMELSALQIVDPSTLDASQVRDLAARAHKLRGTAGNLGARVMHEAATQAEEAVRGELKDRVVDDLRRFLHEGARLREAIQHVLTQMPSLQAPCNDSARPLDADSLSAFMRLLREQNLDAIALFSELTPCLRERLGSAVYTELRAAIDVLDFATAARLVVGLNAS